MTAGGGLAGRVILVVEDDYLIVQDMVRRFRAAGATVVGPAPTVDRALGLVEDSPRLDGAVLDISLRGRMVYRVAERLRDRGVPFVVATGYDEADIPPRYADVPRCLKPLGPDRIAGILFG